MAKLDDYNAGDFLNQVDLSQHIASMGIAVAQAQEKLDSNSVNQLLALAEPVPGLGGKSLLELNLIPAFYHFERATLTASVSMSLELTEEFEADLSVDFNNSRQTEKVTFVEAVRLRDMSKNLKINSTEYISFSGESSVMNKIHNVSEQNEASDTHFAIAERVALTDAQSDTTYTEQFSETAQFSGDNTGLIIVPPAGKKIGIWKIEGEDELGDLSPSLDAAVSADPKAAALELLADAKLAGFQGGILTKDSSGIPPEADLSKIFFNTNSYALSEAVILENGTSATYAWRVRALAEIAIWQGLAINEVIGHTDDVGTDEANQKLSDLRARAVGQVLSTRGATVGNVDGEGESLASTSGDEVQFRRVDVTLDGLATGAVFLFLESADATASITAEPSTSSASTDPYFIFAYEASSHTSASISAGFNQQTNSAYEASSEGELVYVTNSTGSTKDIAELYIFEKRDSQMEGDEQTSEELVKSRSVNTSKEKQETKKVKKASALAASANARYSRMFGTSMSGNMSISAELLSVSCPDELLKHVKTITAGPE